MGQFVRFEVEQAGCATCAARVTEGLAGLVEIERLEVDADANSAWVFGRPRADASEHLVNDALESASTGAGHAYRVRPGTWGTAEP